LLALESISVALYLGRTGQFGFPLDDAWIHQTYARNLGLHGIMAFSPGIPSTGSTSFLWTLLLALGYFIKVPFFLWTYFWGGIFAAMTAFLAALLYQEYFGNFRNSVIVAVICILEWHLAWAAVSGMEIGFFTFLTLLFFLLLAKKASPILLGGLTGILVLVRPEGIIFVLVYGLHLLLIHPREIKPILIKGIALVFTFLVVISPWIVFNLTYSGRPFPNTIVAKFMHYGSPWSAWRSLKYIGNVIIYFLLRGPLLLILPSSVFEIYNAYRTRNTFPSQPLVWSFTLIGLYAVALPTVLDHGRYLMPLIPLIIIFGMHGLTQLLETLTHTTMMRSTIWILLFGMVLLLWINGSSDFSFRTRLLNDVHTRAAKWINENVPKEAVIATHDIGLIGYYTERQIIDLVGLVTPEVVPLMKDPQKMAEYLQAHDVSYLIVYTGYYDDLLTLLHAGCVFSPNAERLQAMGVEPFEVYKIDN
jgi:hypothetical protein